MKRTFKDACEYIADSVKNGLSPESEAVKRRVNHCQEDLMMRLNSKFKRSFMMLYSQNGFITCPSSVERIIKHTVEDLPRSNYSEAYQFLDYGPGSNDRLASGGRHGDLLDLGANYATFFDPHVPMRLMAFSDSTLDKEIEIEVQGSKIDTHLHPVASFDNAGGVMEKISVIPRYGETAPMVWMPERATKQEFCKIDAFIKPVTHGNIALVGWSDIEGQSPQIFILGKYGKRERVANYRRYRVSGYDGGTVGVYALVELAHVDMVDDNEILSVQNLAALKAESKAIDVLDMDAGRSIHFQNIATKLVTDQLRNTYDKATSEITFDVDCMSGPRGL